MRRRSGTRPEFRYVPIDDLAGTPHIVVDGAPRRGTVLTLSHWPGTPTPESLWADVSAEIVLRALHSPGLLPVGVDVVTLDHFDADGALSLALLVFDGLAETHGDLAARAAHAGDFDVVRDRKSALVAFALASMGDRGLGGALQVVPSLLAEPEAFEELWGPELKAFDASCRMLVDGAIEVEERADLDLAVVRVDPRHPAVTDARWGDASVHPAPVCSHTSCLRVITLTGRHYDVRYRYESWVRLATRRPRPRVDLTGLARRLQTIEEDGSPWAFDGAGALTPVLRRVDQSASTIAPERFVVEIVEALKALDAQPPAWDPYAPVQTPAAS